MNKNEKSIIVKHIPHDLNDDEKMEFLKFFGAKHIVCMSDKGPLKHAVFADFDSPEQAGLAVQLLHQQQLLPNTRPISVEFSRTPTNFPSHTIGQSTDAYKPDNKQKTAPEEEQSHSKQLSVEWLKELLALCPTWRLNEPMNFALQYHYPQPNLLILTNIVRALSQCPKFYTQVLHLMNRMHLPPPFHSSMPFPGSLLVVDETSGWKDLVEFGQRSVKDNPQEGAINMDVSSGEESEIRSSSSDTEHQKRNVKSRRTAIRRAEKRRKLNTEDRVKSLLRSCEMVAQCSQLQPSHSTTQVVENVFEMPRSTLLSGKIELHLEREHEQSTANVFSQHSVEEGGFGKLAPQPEVIATQLPLEEEDANASSALQGTLQYFTEEELHQGQLDSTSLEGLSIMKNYERGDTTCRLYVKNLHKSVTPTSLEAIFGGFVNWNDSLQASAFHVKLLTEGRMKGQAFVSYHNEETASRALRLTHGFVVESKPMIVSFGRGAKAQVDARSFLIKQSE